MFDHYSSKISIKLAKLKQKFFYFEIIGNTVNATVIRESYNLFYLLQKLVKQNELALEIDDKSPCDLSKNQKKKLFASSLEQINSTLNRYGTSM